MKIIADRDIPFIQNYFGDDGELILKPGRLIERADLIDADVLLVRSVTRVDEHLLHGTPVKFVGTVTTGIDHLDTVWLDHVGIIWRAAAGYNAIPVAEYVICVVAALYQQQVLPPSLLRVGVVGVGQVGRRVVERFKILGFQIFLCDPPRADQEEDFVSTRLIDMSQLDLITLHTPLTYKDLYPTYHMIDSSFLKTAPKQNILLNTSRGGVIDFASLKKYGKNWIACFDVWENEPEIDLEVVSSTIIASPHISGYSVQCRYRGMAMVYQYCCETQLIKQRKIALPPIPEQTLSFNNKFMTWQEIVLAVFDPLSVTQKLKDPLLKSPGKCAEIFDELRHHYIGHNIKRHEFAYTTISQVRLKDADRYVLNQLGFTIKE